MNLGDSQVDLLSRLLGASAERAKVLANNISNQNTPGYLRQEVRFEELLEAELQRGGDDVGAVVPEVVEDHDTPTGPDGNNVNLELELNAMRENRLLYETYTSILQGHFELIRSSIQDLS